MLDPSATYRKQPDPKNGGALFQREAGRKGYPSDLYGTCSR